MYFDEEIARLKLVGTKGAPLTAPTWFNGPAGGSLDLAGKVTLLEFTAHRAVRRVSNTVTVTLVLVLVAQYLRWYARWRPGGTESR